MPVWRDERLGDSFELDFVALRRDIETRHRRLRRTSPIAIRKDACSARCPCSGLVDQHLDAVRDLTTGALARMQLHLRSGAWRRPDCPTPVISAKGTNEFSDRPRSFTTADTVCGDCVTAATRQADTCRGAIVTCGLQLVKLNRKQGYTYQLQTGLVSKAATTESSQSKLLAITVKVYPQSVTEAWILLTSLQRCRDSLNVATPNCPGCVSEGADKAADTATPG